MCIIFVQNHHYVEYVTKVMTDLEKKKKAKNEVWQLMALTKISLMCSLSTGNGVVK